VITVVEPIPQIATLSLCLGCGCRVPSLKALFGACRVGIVFAFHVRATFILVAIIKPCLLCTQCRLLATMLLIHLHKIFFLSFALIIIIIVVLIVEPVLQCLHSGSSVSIAASKPIRRSRSTWTAAGLEVC